MFTGGALVVVITFLGAGLTTSAKVKVGNFTTPATRPVFRSNTSGGIEGRGLPFDDTLNGTLLFNITGIHSLILTYSYNQIESLQVTYTLSNGSLYEAPRHGGDSGTFPPVKVKLASGEYIKTISGESDDLRVNWLSISTLNTKNLFVKSYEGPFGAAGKHNFSAEGYTFGFHGRVGDTLYSFGIYQLAPVRKSSSWGGGYYSQAFDENPDLAFSPPAVKITRLSVYHGELVYAIQAEYQLWGGVVKKGVKYGYDEGHSRTIITLAKDERITGVVGKGYVYGQLCQLSFISVTADGKTKTHGPFGTAPGTEDFAFQGDMIVGYYGSAASDTKAIDSFGIYYISGL